MKEKKKVITSLWDVKVVGGQKIIKQKYKTKTAKIIH